MKAYEGKRFEYSIEGPGRIVLGNPGDVATAPMHGFSVIWQADAAKDPEGKARFVMEVK
jgi:predicted YcjX-like family ATPase